MNFPVWTRLKEAVRAGVAGHADEAAPQSFERDAVLIVKAVFLLILGYYLFFSSLLDEPPPSKFNSLPLDLNWQHAFSTIRAVYGLYVAVNVGTALLLLGAQHLKPVGQLSLILFGAALDAVFLAALVAVTGTGKEPSTGDPMKPAEVAGDSVLYWLYVILIIRNCISVKAAPLQFSLNLFTILTYAAGAVADAMIHLADQALKTGEPEPKLDPFLVLGELGSSFYLRLLLLAAVALWCYGLQALLLRQRRATDEQRELALRRLQLAASGRLAAEIAHQLKNPLAIINTASYTLQKTVKEGKTITQQIQIIREEVDKSDRLITELMGYSQLAEGRVEKLDLKEEIEIAIARVFPPALKFEVAIHRDYAIGLPELLAQRGHLQDIFGNLLQNARDVMHGRGNIWITTRQGDNFSILVTLEDDGPGIAPELRERVFEAYFTTREKGTGLGLAIVKHNVEMYGGQVWLESGLGRGARFVLQLPARTMMRLRK